jgi:hypothetical protein
MIVLAAGTSMLSSTFGVTHFLLLSLLTYHIFPAAICDPNETIILSFFV